ncbi:nitronate monooxygenase [Leptospira borgpetersenii serovar Ballum]|uniref:Nitronate monooxygenase n=5 Tax=Leptospiraceae TaxID=170 RepID=M3HLZ0_LEPBO|nr:nitronate monooxygenase [Leptospira borgpetersenii serovar Ballum]ANH01520.1 Nitronate monooxygenase [Leptospira borgpetersenii str. 4E]EKP15215.1 nitronate monooxygenase [Leptospira borgpetersenii str. 200801926]EKQ99019.1 nitronate monooxygenase [Leptospira borgpetersenii serovar Castellonis str. 200801910]EMF99075.1 nitronate monooxygenase [Leptospira borgpetersenii str. 200701203]EMN13660.1 nitronate monooxygenase [Leptospira borgpetersenii str. Brem 307]EMN16518.1 nitronate monooxygen
MNAFLLGRKILLVQNDGNSKSFQMKLNTKITEMLGIDLPIIGAPMFLVSYPDLVVAVSEAGGIGCFPSLNYRSPEQLKEGLQEIRSKTKKPIGVNLILHKSHNPNWSKQLEVILDAKVELLITSLGSPRTVVNEAKSIGSKVFCDVTTLKHANIVAKAGADALIAVAQGAGGHAGNISPFSLYPYLKKETGLPLIAAGAISNGAQMLAAFALGADAVYVGTRLIATPEAMASEEYKKMLIESGPEEIVYTERISGIPANWLKKSVEKAGDLSHSGGSQNLDQEYKRWKDIWSAGHGVAQIEDLIPAKELILGMAKEYQDILNRLPR